MKRENLTIVVLACLAWVLLSHTSVSIVFLALALVLAIYCRASRLDRLQVEEYVAVYDILSRGSGDTRITEEFRGASALRGMTVKTMTNFFESNSGYFPTLSYRNCRPASQEINWRWLDSTGMRRRVIAEFNPPLRNEKVDSAVKAGATTSSPLTGATVSTAAPHRPRPTRSESRILWDIGISHWRSVSISRAPFR